MCPTIRKSLYSILASLLTIQFAIAVPATPYPITHLQPNGSSLTVYLRGDEYAGYTETTDGFAIAKNAKGNYEYVLYSSKNKCQLSGILAHNPAERNAAEKSFVQTLPKAAEQNGIIEMRSFAAKQHLATTATATKASFPLTGNVRSLVILVNYSDVAFTIENPQAAYTALLNETNYSTNGGTGSANDYFLASSNNLFNPIFDVVGPYTLSHNQAYYGSNTDTDHSSNAAAMITEACGLAYAAGVDFTLYDENNDGRVDNVFVYYAGHNEAEGGSENSVWPHRSTLPNGPTYDGKTVYDYACTSELRGNSGSNMCGIGTFCHEFGHVLGLPDFYNTDNGSNYTVGNWDIMCSGSYNNNGRTPPVYTAFERFSLGWLQPEQIISAGQYILEPLETSNTAYIIAATKHNMSATSPNPSEYFMIENRQRIGWDAPESCLPGVGLLISRINYNASKWTQNKPNNDPNNLGFDIMEAYNKTPTTSSASDTYPGTQHITTFIPTLNDGTILSEMTLTNIIQNSNLNVSFAFSGGDGSGFTFFPSQLGTLTTTYDNGIVNWDYKTLDIIGKRIDTNETLNISLNNANFEFSVDSMKTWVYNFNDVINADSTYRKTLFVRHSPRRQNCNNTTSGILKIATSLQTQVNQLNLTGYAPRPTYITTPDANKAQNITPYSFFASWEPVTDADIYYLTVYKLIDSPSTILQSFENFTDQTKIAAEGWYANFINTTTSLSSNGIRSLLFSASGDTLISEKYVQPITNISFWVSSNYISSSTGTSVGGELTLEACNANGWHNIDGGTINVLRTTNNLTKNYTFPIDSNYVQFRLSYTHIGGSGGAAVDAFTAGIEKTISYICKNEEKAIYAPDTLFYINNLEANTDYYYQVQAYENKGCEAHLTELSAPMKVTTLPGETNNSKRLTVLYENGSFVAYVPVADTKRRLYIYTVQGNMVTSIGIETLQNRIEIPQLQAGNIYLLKYSEEGKMRRKDLWGKIICQ